MNSRAADLPVIAESSRFAIQRWLGYSAGACAAVAVLLWMLPALLRPDLYSDDATQHVYWLYKYADPALFPHDLSIEYFSSLSVAPWGYRLLYTALAPFGDALLVAKVVALVLLLLSAYLAWLIGTALDTKNRPLTGLFAVATLLCLLPVVDLLPNIGFQRTFALPAALLCTWALIARRYFWVGVSWVFASLMYPVIVPVLGLTAGFVFLGDLVRERRMPEFWIWNGVMGVLAIAHILLTRGVPPDIGPMVSYAQAQTMAEFAPNGRQSLFGDTFREYWFGHHRTGLGWSPKLVLLLLGATAVVLVLGKRKQIPRALWFMAGIGVTLWFIARQVLFNLYLPNRHSRWALAVFAVAIVAAAGYAALDWLIARTQDRQKQWAIASRLVAIVAPLVVAAVLFPAASRAWRTPVDVDLERTYQFLGTLPKDTLIASHPTVADSVPLRTRRSVLASTENWISFQLGYTAQLTPRLAASLQASYATNWDDFDRALEPYGADVFLVAPYLWSTPTFDAPFDKLVAGLVEKGRQQGFVLRTPPPERVLFRSGAVYVVKVDKAPHLAATPPAAGRPEGMSQ